MTFANDDSYKIMERIDKSCTGKLKWKDFRDEFVQWIKYSNTYTLILVKLDYGIHLSPQVIYSIVKGKSCVTQDIWCLFYTISM